MKISSRTWIKVEEHVSSIQMTEINRFNNKRTQDLKRLIEGQSPRPCEQEFKLKGFANGFRGKSFSCPEPETFS